MVARRVLAGDLLTIAAANDRPRSCPISCSPSSCSTASCPVTIEDAVDELLEQVGRRALDEAMSR